MLALASVLSILITGKQLGLTLVHCGELPDPEKIVTVLTDLKQFMSTEGQRDEVLARLKNLRTSCIGRFFSSEFVALLQEQQPLTTCDYYLRVKCDCGSVSISKTCQQSYVWLALKFWVIFGLANAGVWVAGIAL